MFPQDIFFQLPKPTALLILSSLFSLASAHALPRQTPTTVPYRSLNVVAYPPLPAPTSPPVDLQTFNELLRRQDTNTICGYIGGDPSLPATCSAGSHCVVDADHAAVGCCPNGQETCTAGVFTGCVDSNSGAQTEVNPYVFTCAGSNVCYKNVFEGGLSQWGCGTASDLAATVSESATGVSSEVQLTSVSVSFAQSTSTTATGTATSSGRHSSSDSASSLTTLNIPSPTTTADPTSTSDLSSSPSSSSPSATSTDPSAPEANANSGKEKHTGAIVGGTIGAVVALAAIAAAAIYFWRRRAARNSRQGPGPRAGDTQYISPMSGGDGFTPLPGGPNGGGGQRPASVRGKTITHIIGGPDSRNTVWHDGGIGDQHDPGNRSTTWLAGAGVGAGAAAYEGAYASPHDSSGEDEIPLRHSSPEMEEFSRGFHDALSRIGEEDEDELDEVNRNGTMSGNNGGGSRDIGESKPLWLQSRRQSRNLMWT
ncbi:hypothetical protein VP1G_01244 [Cytospora mali]|uniref:Carcinoembryonic antigen-related cell adhesion molecule 1 n=1 Tax=Cytospora mali TaxID=578113 RepID=A0A194UQ16_CYTMA|nr:hypothetical protein VP1G_01244 [Valsa mali var. pyri (nom. inval.)]